MLKHTKRQVKYTMRNLFVMFVTAVSFLFLLKMMMFFIFALSKPKRKPNEINSKDLSLSSI